MSVGSTSSIAFCLKLIGSIFSGRSRAGTPSPPPVFKYPMKMSETKLFHFRGIFKKIIDIINKAVPQTFKLVNSFSIQEILDTSLIFCKICNSYTMECTLVRGDHLRALTSGLSHVPVDNHGITIYFVPPISCAR